MADTITPILGLTKPEVTGSIDTWGGKLNTNFDKIDERIGTNTTKSDNALKKDSPDALERTVKQFLYYDPSITAKPHEGDAKALMTNESVRFLINYLMPIGTIIMWAGTVATIPAGWALCNGAIVNGNQTPNLLDRFVIQAGQSWAPGSTGGNSTLNYAGAVGGHVLTLNEMPYHDHYVNDPGHYHSITSTDSANAPAGNPGNDQGVANRIFYANTNSKVTGIWLNYSGANWAHDHPFGFSIPWNVYWPQFYALCYIMKVYPI